jgi:hypothetical protein
MDSRDFVCGGNGAFGGNLVRGSSAANQAVPSEPGPKLREGLSPVPAAGQGLLPLQLPSQVSVNLWARHLLTARRQGGQKEDRDTHPHAYGRTSEPIKLLNFFP